MSKTLFEKVWEQHVVHQIPNGPEVLYIDRQLLHEVTSPQAFDFIKEKGVKLRCPERMLATADHNVPTENHHLPIENQASAKAVATLEKNCTEHGVQLFGMNHSYQGIVHVIGPELGFSLPGMTIVCGDSHTSTHGAFGSIAFGIGTSEIAMVMATQCLLQYRPKTMRIDVSGTLSRGVSAKDLILYIISELGTGGGTGYFIEFTGDCIANMSMEERMTICNMSIEMGARGALIAPDETSFAYVKNKMFSPKGKELEKLETYWKTLYTDKAAQFDMFYGFDAGAVSPMITYGTNPGMGISITGHIPEYEASSKNSDLKKALAYMDFNAGESIEGKAISHVFIGSCTNGRIEDLRAVSSLVKGKEKAKGVRAIVVPGSRQVAIQAEKEGIKDILIAAGFEFREPGCSACLAMNDDKIPAGAYCVSTSNRNFEGRQGQGARTLLASPISAAAAALKGEITDVRQLINEAYG